MVIFFGPPGAGKSVQGQILAARHSWRWISTGQLLRDTHDQRIHDIMNRGEFVSDEDMNKVVAEALQKAHDVENIVLDGFPRKVEQAEWLLQNVGSFYPRGIQAVVSLDVPDDELYERLHIRGRADDTLESITKRSDDYRRKTLPVLSFLEKRGVYVGHVDGEGSVGTVHDRIEKAIEACTQK